jgi:hypothetical protein
MSLAQTWHVWIWFRTPDTIVFTNHDHIRVLSRQGRPLRNAPADPDKSGHRPTCRIIVRSALRTCPDLRGTLRPLVTGHATKKDIFMLNHIGSFMYNPETKCRGHLLRYQYIYFFFFGHAGFTIGGAVRFSPGSMTSNTPFCHWPHSPG